MASRSLRAGAILIMSVALFGCATGLPPAPLAAAVASSEYRIGVGDKLQVFVWRNPELSNTASSGSSAASAGAGGTPVRPDGRISLPLVEDVVAVGKTPTELARDIEQRLSTYVQNPIVTVIDTDFIGQFARQIRIVGEAAVPRALPYRANMTVLDAMIEVGGLTKYAAGNRARLIRIEGGAPKTYGVRLDSLINRGEIQDNIALAPGDILVIPQSYF